MDKNKDLNKLEENKYKDGINFPDGESSKVNKSKDGDKDIKFIKQQCKILDMSIVIAVSNLEEFNFIWES